MSRTSGRSATPHWARYDPIHFYDAEYVHQKADCVARLLLQKQEVQMNDEKMAENAKKTHAESTAAASKASISTPKTSRRGTGSL